MAYIKKTNIIGIENISETIRKVQCPYCKTFLQHIPDYITAMKCWHCKKEFRIEHDKDKIIDPGSHSGRTIIGRIRA